MTDGVTSGAKNDPGLQTLRGPNELAGPKRTNAPILSMHKEPTAAQKDAVAGVDEALPVVDAGRVVEIEYPHQRDLIAVGPGLKVRSGQGVDFLVTQHGVEGPPNESRISCVVRRPPSRQIPSLSSGRRATTASCAG